MKTFVHADSTDKKSHKFHSDVLIISHELNYPVMMSVLSKHKIIRVMNVPYDHISDGILHYNLTVFVVS